MTSYEERVGGPLPTMPKAQKRSRVLALDDEETIMRFIREIGERAGFEVVASVTATPFKEALARHTPDVIVLDLHLPEMDGVDISRFLASQNVCAGIVLVSGLDERTISAARRYGRGKDWTSWGRRTSASRRRTWCANCGLPR